MRRLLLLTALVAVLAGLLTAAIAYDGPVWSQGWPNRLGGQLQTFCLPTMELMTNAAARRAVGFWCDRINTMDGMFMGGGTQFDDYYAWNTNAFLQTHGDPFFWAGNSKSQYNENGRCPPAPYTAASCSSDGANRDSWDYCSGCYDTYWFDRIDARRDIFLRDSNGWRLAGYNTASNPAVCSVAEASGACTANSYGCMDATRSLASSGRTCTIGGSECLAESGETCVDMAGFGCSSDRECGAGTCGPATGYWRYCKSGTSTTSHRCESDVECATLGAGYTCSHTVAVAGGGNAAKQDGCSWVTNPAEMAKEIWQYWYQDQATADRDVTGTIKTDGPRGPSSEPNRFIGEFGSSRGARWINTDNTSMAYCYGDYPPHNWSGAPPNCSLGGGSTSNIAVNPYGATHRAPTAGDWRRVIAPRGTLTGPVLRRLQAEYFHLSSTAMHNNAPTTGYEGASRGGYSGSHSPGVWMSKCQTGANAGKICITNADCGGATCRTDWWGNIQNALYRSSWCSNSHLQCTDDGVNEALECPGVSGEASGECVTFIGEDGVMSEQSAAIGGSTDSEIMGLGARTRVRFWNMVARSPDPVATNRLSADSNAWKNTLFGDDIWRREVAHSYLVYYPGNVEALSSWHSTGTYASCYFCSGAGSPWQSCTGTRVGVTVPGYCSNSATACTTDGDCGGGWCMGRGATAGKEGCFADAMKGLIKTQLGCPLEQYDDWAVNDPDRTDDVASGQMIFTRKFQHGWVVFNYSYPNATYSGLTIPTQVGTGSEFCRWERAGANITLQSQAWEEQCGFTKGLSGTSISLTAGEAWVFFEKNPAAPGQGGGWSESDCDQPCGNGKVDSNETCDNGIYNSSSGPCYLNCQGTTSGTGYCGDGIAGNSSGEQCDDGNTSNTDSCLNNCQSATCGDGYTRVGVEACDDGNALNTDACINTCVLASCGDGFTWIGVEACDDGNALQTDACLNTCVAATCGDGFVRTGVEGCDDGNTNNGDGCSSTCQSEACGNGVLNPGEQCDDGNLVNTDACAGCQNARCGDGYIRTGVEQCDDGNAVNTDSCVSCQNARCGDNYIQAGVEQCDDGNTAAGDGCSATCQTEGCGNGVVNPPEQCDDGNASNTDGCLNTCVSATCGDGFVRAGVETCDDGNTVAGDGCSDTCQTEIGAQCGNGVLRTTAYCEHNTAMACNVVGGVPQDAECQNPATGGVTLSSCIRWELCDDGNTSWDDGCSADCMVEPSVDKNLLEANSTFTGAITPWAFYSNAVSSSISAATNEAVITFTNVSGGTNMQFYLNTLAYPILTDELYRVAFRAKCTNGGGECEGGNDFAVIISNPYPETQRYTYATKYVDLTSTMSTYVLYIPQSSPPRSLSIDADLRIAFWFPGYASNGDVYTIDDVRLVQAYCGNGLVDYGYGHNEICDDGNLVNGDGCDEFCQDEYGYTCNGDPSVCVTVCGDGQVAGTEVCDEGSNNSDSPNATCRNDCSTQACGDGILDDLIVVPGPSPARTEACDDGNLVSGDGCDAVCQIEKVAACPDGVVDDGEECDDGNASDNDACLQTCLDASCGDGYVWIGVETCDDGNASNTDACLNTCATASCGDGYVRTNIEQCDDGNTDNGDGCSSACSLENTQSLQGGATLTGGTLL